MFNFYFWSSFSELFKTDALKSLTPLKINEPVRAYEVKCVLFTNVNG